MKNLRLCRRFFCFLRRGEEYAKMPSGKGVGAMWYVYMLRCGDGSLYTGSTTDVARRLREHQIGTGAKNIPAAARR